MNWPFVLRSRHDADVAALNADRDRLRRRAETAEGHAATAVSNRKQVLRQHAELDAANTRLAGWNRELRRRLDDHADGQYVAQLEARLIRLTRGTGRWMAACWTERAESRAMHGIANRANTAVEEMGVKLRASEERARLAVQGLRPEEWESRPIDGAPRVRREAPGEELQRALDRCAQLEGLLAKAEGRPAGVKL